MTRQRLFIVTVALISGISATIGCGLFQQVFTQATATPTPTITPTITPTLEPDLSEVALTLDDLPPGFVPLPLNELGISVDDFGGDDFEFESFFLFLNAANFEYVMGFTTLLQSAPEQAGFDAVLLTSQEGKAEIHWPRSVLEDQIERSLKYRDRTTLSLNEEVVKAERRRDDRAKMFSIVVDLADGITKGLNLPPLSPEQLQERQQRSERIDPDAVRLYTRALLYADRGDTERAIDLFNQVTTRFPEYTEAHEALRQIRGS